MTVLDITGLEEHPLIPMPHPALDKLEREAFLLMRKERLLRERVDPLRWGFELDIWKKADALRAEKRKKYPKGVIYEVDLGGNRSGKSERAAKRVVQACLEKPGSRWWCCDSTEEQSRMNQQRYIERYLPQEWKPGEDGRLGKKLSRTTKIRYTVAGGFTENNLILPNTSEIFFKFYAMDIKSLPGPELDGVWADELIPLDWISVLTYRLTNRNGVFHVTFTPELGWTPTVGHLLDGATILEEEDADPDLLPKFNDEMEFVGPEKVIRLQQPRNDKAIVLYFFTSDNPFGNYEGMKIDVSGKAKSEVLMRVYGNVSKGAYAQFPLFRDDVHVLSEAQVKQMMFVKDTDKPASFERYQFVDPCPGRNWFMLWIACFNTGDSLIYREWPSFGHPGAYIEGIGDPGPWAVSGDAHDGVRGKAQDGFGFGFERYKDEILQKEQGEEIVERWIDSRYANSPQQEREGTTTLIEQMAEIELDFRAATSEKSILNTNDGSIDMINSALYYNQNLPIGAMDTKRNRPNKPRLYVSELCPNTIWSLKNWTGKDGQKAACKDSVDCIRMKFLSSVEFLGRSAYAWTR